MFPKRWVACFDILGFSNLIKSSSFYSNPSIVLEVYEKALQDAKNELQTLNSTLEGTRINRLHFSDTFLFYSKDDTPESYSWIQSVAKNFIRHCLDGDPSIPLRGAIAYGEFYADQDKGIYFGEAFIEAYEGAESQNWIGLILTKTVESKVHEYGLYTSRHQFPVVNVPIKKEYKTKYMSINLFTKIKHPAYSFHAENLEQTTRIQTLKMMKQYAEEKDKIKYQNTIDHIKRLCRK